RCVGILSRNETSAHEEIDISVAVKVRRHHHTVRAGQIRRPSRVWGFAEGAMPVVEIKLSGTSSEGHSGLSSASAEHEVKIAIAVRVEQKRAQLVKSQLAWKGRLRGQVKTTVCFLNEELPHVARCSRKIEIVQAIAVDITNS